MTTITIQEEVDFTKTHFQSIDELLMTVYHMRNLSHTLDFHELWDEEISLELKKKIEYSKDQSLSSFSSISHEISKYFS